MKPKRRWSREETSLILKLYENGVKPSQIACRVSASRDMIEALLKKWGVERKYRKASQ